MASSTGTPQAGKALKGQKVTVSVDNTEEQVVQWDKEGATLVFDARAGKFLEMDSTKLSKANADSYKVSKMMYEELAEDDPMADVFSKIDFGSSSLKASQKMATPDDENFVYGFRSDADLQEALEAGYKVVTDQKTNVNRSGKGISKLKGRNGGVEQVMVKIPRDEYNRRLQKGHEDIERFVSGEDARAREEFNRRGAAGSDLDAKGVKDLDAAAE